MLWPDKIKLKNITSNTASYNSMTILNCVTVH